MTSTRLTLWLVLAVLFTAGLTDDTRLHILAASYTIVVLAVNWRLIPMAWRHLNAIIDDLPRRMDDWVHDHRERERREPDAKVEARRTERLRNVHP
jgi:hypothetical protein